MENKHYEYLDNTLMPVQLLGLSPLANPFAKQVSAQRGMMFASHLQQCMLPHGCEPPMVMSGFEPIIGDYEHNTTKRNQDVQIISIIQRYASSAGLNSIQQNPYFTVVYQGCEDRVVSYFNIYRYTMRSKGYGYKNKFINTALLEQGSVLPKDVKLVTSPAHKGNDYCLGTNLKVAYMSLPTVTEDAFMISETAAEKLNSDAYSKVSIEISPDQLPLNLYGTEEEYKFLPDIGETVNEFGELCALRKPTVDSAIYDMNPRNLTKIQGLHDDVTYVPVGSTIVNIEVAVNHNCKQKYSEKLYSQIKKYDDCTVEYCQTIYNLYMQLKKEGKEISPRFNSLVTRAMERLMVSGIPIPGFKARPNLTLVKKKKQINFMEITITYCYENKVKDGYKLTGRYGNKGVIASIVPDEHMPVDDYGNRADIIISGASVFNRMNTGQLYEQFFNFGAERIRSRMREMYDKGKWNEAYTLMTDYLKDINPKWGELVMKTHSTADEQKALVQEALAHGVRLQVTPFQEGCDCDTVLEIAEKYDLQPTPVTFGVKQPDGSYVSERSVENIVVGNEYFFVLCKIPHMRGSGIGYVNQYRTPSRPSTISKSQFPFAQTSLKIGEDEHRNIATVAGAETMTRIGGMYGNSQEAVKRLGTHLISAKTPSRLHQLDMTTAEITDGDVAIGIVKHHFSCLGIDIANSLKDLGDERYAHLLTPEKLAQLSNR